MSASEVVWIAVAGLGAGAINTVVGSGTLITFPVLLAFGYAPVTANVSNTIGLVPGSVSGAVGYRRELARPACARAATGERVGARRDHRCGAAAACCPHRPSRRSCPVFIALALVLTVLQPRLNRWLAARDLDLEQPCGAAAARARCI